MSAPEGGYLTRRDLCDRFKISRATAYRWEADGYLPRPVRVGPRSVRWAASEISAFEARLAADRGGAP